MNVNMCVKNTIIGASLSEPHTSELNDGFCSEQSEAIPGFN